MKLAVGSIKTARSVISSIDTVLYKPIYTKSLGGIRYFLIFLLLVLGIIHWIGFLNFGDAHLSFYDWEKESLYLDTLRNAYAQHSLPWKLTQLYYHSEYFFANPEITLTPDILLLSWISNQTYFTLHVIVFYIMGFAGILVMANSIKASFVAFTFLWLIFSFNGFITSHLAVGHLQWTGYFLLPTLFYFLIELTKQKTPVSASQNNAKLSIALLLGLLFLNGSLHVAIWFIMFLIFCSFADPKIRSSVVSSISLGLLLGTGRLLPAVVHLKTDYGFVTGYPSLTSVLDGFTRLRAPSFDTSDWYWGSIGWWEYDIYVGFIAFFILTSSFAFAIKRVQTSDLTPILVAAIIMLILSLGNIYSLITNSPLPFASTERIPSRFIVIPFFVLVFVAMIGLDEMLRTYHRTLKPLLVVAVMFSANEFAMHSKQWRAENIDAILTSSSPAVPEFTTAVGNGHLMLVVLGWSISVVTLCLIALNLFRSTNHLKN